MYSVRTYMTVYDPHLADDTTFPGVARYENANTARENLSRLVSIDETIDECSYLELACNPGLGLTLRVLRGASATRHPYIACYQGRTDALCTLVPPCTTGGEKNLVHGLRQCLRVPRRQQEGHRHARHVGRGGRARTCVIHPLISQSRLSRSTVMGTTVLMDTTSASTCEQRRIRGGSIAVHIRKSRSYPKDSQVHIT